MKYRRSAKRKRGSAQPQGIDRRYSGFVPDHCGYPLRRRRTRILLTPAFIDLHGPRGAALRVAGSQMRDEFRASEFNRVSVMQHAIDFRGGASLRVAFGVGNVSVHDHQPRSGLFLDDAYGCIMIAVRMTGKDDLGVAVFETELSDALFNGRHGFGKIRVDENVSLGCVDQVYGAIVGFMS